MRPDLSPTALTILPGITWPEMSLAIAPKSSVAVASPTLPLPPLPLPVSATAQLSTTTPSPTTKVAEPEKVPLPDLNAIIPATGPANPSAPVVPSLLQSLPAGAWLVYVPPVGVKK